MRHLDFLIRDPVRTVMLHDAGIAMTVPDPARYAVHKLIVAAQPSRDRDKAAKDLVQAIALARALAATRRHMDLGAAYQEAQDRGRAWREAIVTSVGRRSVGDAEPFRRAAENSMRLDE
jgi:hypothetical protein